MLCGVKPTVGSNPTATAKSAGAPPKVGSGGFFMLQGIWEERPTSDSECDGSHRREVPEPLNSQAE